MTGRAFSFSEVDIQSDNGRAVSACAVRFDEVGKIGRGVKGGLPAFGRFPGLPVGRVAVARCSFFEFENTDVVQVGAVVNGQGFGQCCEYAENVVNRYAGAFGQVVQVELACDVCYFHFYVALKVF